ncbi:MAG: carboxypeptidase regulatory-like domain-containing protein [bacterium]|nr:carboxypeptidase regulatory-like domain-containing protein [bacterium]
MFHDTRSTIHEKGFSLIELLITIGIIGVLGMGLWSAWVIGLQVTTEKRAEITATAIATEQIERLKTLPYTTLGTIGGIPSGSTPRETIIMRNGITYTVQTAVFYIDDPFDGKAPQDPIPADYKRIRVSAIWNGKFGVSPVVLMTDAAPKGLETTAGGGTLIIHVADAQRAPVSDATVTIKNTKTVPPIDTVLATDSNGQLVIPGAPASQEGYDVTVTKSDYSSDATIRAAVGINPSPEKPPLSVTEGQTTEPSFFIDRLATLTVTTVDNHGGSEKNVTLTITGAKTVGVDGEGKPIPKFTTTKKTNGAGVLTLSAIEWDTYAITLNGVATGYDISATAPILPIFVAPGSTTTERLTLASHRTDTLLVTVKDKQTPLVGASVRITNADKKYDKTIVTGEEGQSFFSPLASDTPYDLTVTKQGYTTMTTNVHINGQTYEDIAIAPL